MNNRLEELLKEPRMGKNGVAINENSLEGLLELINYYDITNKDMVEIGCLSVFQPNYSHYTQRVSSV